MLDASRSPHYFLNPPVIVRSSDIIAIPIQEADKLVLRIWTSSWWRKISFFIYDLDSQWAKTRKIGCGARFIRQWFHEWIKWFADWLTPVGSCVGVEQKESVTWSCNHPDNPRTTVASWPRINSRLYNFRIRGFCRLSLHAASREKKISRNRATNLGNS